MTTTTMLMMMLLMVLLPMMTVVVEGVMFLPLLFCPPSLLPLPTGEGLVSRKAGPGAEAVGPAVPAPDPQRPHGQAGEEHQGRPCRGRGEEGARCQQLSPPPHAHAHAAPNNMSIALSPNPSPTILGSLLLPAPPALISSASCSTAFFPSFLRFFRPSISFLLVACALAPISVLPPRRFRRVAFRVPRGGNCCCCRLLLPLPC